MYDIINLDVTPEENIIFFGKKSKYLRIDKVSHEKAKILKENSEGNTWFTKEIDMKLDKTRFERLPEDAKRAFKLNIAYQTLMDSGVTAGISEVILKCVTSSIWEMLYRRISTEEMIHSESYSYGLNEVFGSEATEILDLVYTDKVVQKRMDIERSLFRDLAIFEKIDNFNSLNESEKDDLREKLLHVLLALFCLENIKFPFSFLVTFTINDRYENSIPGFTRTIQLIAHDELNTHVPTGLTVFRTLKSEEYQGFSNIFKDDKLNKYIKDLVHETVESEIEWSKYLVEDRFVKGLSIETCTHFIKWRANKTLQLLEIEDNEYKDFNENSTTEFFENYRKINKHNAALQETDNTSYVKGSLKKDW